MSKKITDLTELTTGQLNDSDLLFVYDASAAVLKSTQLDLVQEHVGTTFTRTLLDDADAETARATLGLGVRCRVNMTAAQTGVVNETDTLVVFDTEDFDLGSEFASNTFTAGVTGYYRVSAGIRAADIGDGKVLVLKLQKNGATVVSEALQICGVAGVTGDQSVTISDIVQLDATETIRCLVWQNSGGDLVLLGGGTYGWIAIDRVG